MKQIIVNIKTVIEGLGFRRCHLVGSDIGGSIAWQFAYAFPNIIQSLTTVGGTYILFHT
jgi:pimeloyl-ACP methyl ester carboxylesterase